MHEIIIVDCFLLCTYDGILYLLSVTFSHRMYKYCGSILFLSLIFFANFAHAEYIENLDVDIVINDDATLDVTEYITYDFEKEKKHGIYRNIPVKYKTNSGNNRAIDLVNISVIDENDILRTFVVSREGKDIQIKIGDADTYVTGKQIYIVSYRVDGAMNYFDTHDELYWNAIGGQWDVPIYASHIKVHASQINRVACFTGPYGSTIPCDIATQNNISDADFAQSDIDPGSNVTVVIGMPVDVVYKPDLAEKIMKFIQDNWILMLPFFVFLGMGFAWFKKGRDPKGRGTIIPYYDVPDDLSPAEVAMIVRGSLNKSDISALIIDLAVRGYIKIRRIEKKSLFKEAEYLFIKTSKNINEHTMSDAIKLYESLFAHGTAGEVKTSQLVNVYYKDCESVMTHVRKQTVLKGYFVKNPYTVRSIFIALGICVIVGSFFLSGIFGFAAGLSLALSGVIIAGFGLLMPQKTQKGAIVREQILGLKLYMGTTEKDRINFHNAPAKEPEQFENFLPYAMALGVEKQWAKQFDDIYNKKPDWYDGAGAFYATSLVHDINNFSTTTSGVMTSQAGSGGSGFSGGGSGGGGGGGGGGSW